MPLTRRSLVPRAFSGARATTSEAPQAWTFTRAAEPQRPEIERFIASRFHEAYGARLRRFFPMLMALRQREAVVAACGLRDAVAEPLFLERYLDGCIEQVLSAAVREPIERSRVVEVGNLAAMRAGTARHLILRLTMYLQGAGAAWAVFSAVPTLRNTFVRFGIPLVRLAPADPSRLAPEERDEWGTYYDAQPHVTAVRVEAAHRALARIRCTR